MNPESVWIVWVEGPEGDAYDIAVRAPSKAAAILKVLREEEGYTLSAQPWRHPDWAMKLLS